MMAQNYNRFSQYSAPPQSNQQPLQQNQGYATYGPARSTQESVVTPQYPPASGSTSSAYSSFTNRYQTSSTSGPYSTSQQTTNWYGSSSNNYAQPYSGNENATDQNRSIHTHYQPSNYNSQYGTSGLGNLAYASTLNTGDANHSTENSGTTHSDRYGNVNQLRTAEGYSTSHNTHGHQQARPESVKSVRSRQSNASPAMRAASANNLHQRKPSNNASSHHSHQNQVQQPYQPQSNQSAGAYPTSSIPTLPQSNDRRSSQPQHASHASPNAVSYRDNSSHQGHQVSDNQVETDRQHSASTEPTTPMTVDPAQVYDPYHEIQRQKRQAEAEATARRQEEQRRATEAAQNDQHKGEVPQPTPAAQDQSTAPAPAANTTKKRGRNPGSVGHSKQSEPKAKKKRKIQADASNDEAMRGAAIALMQTANSGGSAEDLEAQMRGMFKKMREFNEKDPSLLSKLWQEERDTHLEKQKHPTETQQSNQSTSTSAIGQASQPQKENKATPKKSTTKKATPKKAENSTTVQATEQTTPAKDETIPRAASGKKQSTLSKPKPQPQPQPQTQSKPAQSSQSSQQPSSTKGSGSTGTVWPADKKATLASAAASLISKMPANAGKAIQPNDISQILDKNPSYVDLCELIEDKGFYLDRSHFAKALLSAVPDVNNRSNQNTTQGQSARQGNTAQASTRISPDTGNHVGSLGDAEARLMEGESVVETPGKKKGGRQPRKAVNQTQPAQTAANDIATNDVAPPALDTEWEGLGPIKAFVDGKDDQQPVEPAPSKSKSHKKKETAPPEPQLTKADTARKKSFADLVDLTQFSEDETENYPPPAPAGASPAVSNTQSQIPTTPQTTMAQQHFPQPGPMAAPTAQMQPSSYPSLPTHYVNEASAKQQNMRVPPVDHPVQNIQVASPLDKHKALRRSTYNPKTIARDVLLATGRHPDMRHLNAHYDQLKQVFQGLQNNGADLSTIRWDVIDPNGPGPGAGLALLPDVMEDEMMADDEESDADSVLDEPRHDAQDISGNGVGLATRAVHGPIGSAGHMKKNKFRQSDPGFRRGAESTPNDPRTVPQPTSEKLPRTGGGYTVLRSTDAEAGQKKKGRPVGWRKWMQKDFTGQPGGGGDKGPPRRPGRPPLHKPQPQPNYQVFKCLWQVPRPECGSQLHNLETLRKHVHKVHGKNQEYPMQSGNVVYLCQWQDCGRVVPVSDGQRTVSRMEPRAFANPEEWKRHVETEHIRPVAWELGDGPAGGVSDREASELSDAYMSDRQGRRVTPRVALPDSPEDAAAASRAGPNGVVRPGQQPPKAVTKQKKTAEDEACMEEYEAQERRARMGPGIDREGGRIVGGKGSEKRRMGFIDDDDEGPQVIETDD
ncbi:MAG: hypothetical protein M1831_003564 [Alyxoria varia]|nr:MAG: hypothetical protein M1831_003564 [Alyxoria varia]